MAELAPGESGPRILVAGFGYVGALAAELAAAQGAAVFGLVRTPRDLPSGVTPILGDVTAPDSLTELPTNLDAIIYAVAPDAHDDDAYQRAYPSGLSNLLAATGKARRVILVSSTAVYGQSDGQLIDDESDASAPEPKAAHLRQAEQLALASHPSSLVVRASGIYGPGRTSLARRLGAEAPRPEVRDLYSCRIHRVDLARVLVEAVFDASLSGILLASDTAPATFGELHDFLRSREVPTPDAPAALGAAPASGNVRPSRRERTHRSRRMIPQRLLDRGFSFRYPSFKEGYGELFVARSA